MRVPYLGDNDFPSDFISVKRELEYRVIILLPANS